MYHMGVVLYINTDAFVFGPVVDNLVGIVGTWGKWTLFDCVDLFCGCCKQVGKGDPITPVGRGLTATGGRAVRSHGSCVLVFCVCLALTA